MIALGAWLLVVSVCDLLRATRDTITPRHRWLLVALGVTLLLLSGLWLDLPARGWATTGALGALGLVGWLVGSSRALETGSGRVNRWRTLALVSLLGTLGLLGLVGDAAALSLSLPAMLDASLLGRLGAAPALLVGAAVLAQVSTANVAVRLLLDGVGVPATTNEKVLKGGRVLGPMERVFIVLLGLAGSLTAAAVVVAAKGLLRYPELQRTQREQGPTDLSEYFLIGSFASWLAALVGLAVVWLGLGIQPGADFGW